MKKAVPFISALFILLLFSVNAQAEFYRYTDENGTVRFTDDLSVVPADQRPEISTYSEPDDKLTEEEKAAKQAARQQAIKNQAPKLPEEDSKSAAPGASNAGSEKEYQAAKSRLDKMRGELDQEYEEIMAEVKEVEDLKKNVKRASATRALNSRIRELNTRIATYQQQRQAYEQEAAAVEQKRVMATQ